MEKELHEMLAPKNKLVEQFQKGKLTEEEFQRLLAEQNKADGLEKEWHNADILQDEQEQIELKEVVEAEHYAERAERDAEDAKYQ